MSAKTWKWSNCELTAHSPQPVWAGASFCCEISADRASGAKQNWPVSCTACRLKALASSVVLMVAMSNYTVALQIPIVT